MKWHSNSKTFFLAGAWKSIILQIIEAAEDGGVDALVIESQLDEEATATPAGNRDGRRAHRW